MRGKVSNPPSSTEQSLSAFQIIVNASNLWPLETPLPARPDKGLPILPQRHSGNRSFPASGSCSKKSQDDFTRLAHAFRFTANDHSQRSIQIDLVWRLGSLPPSNPTIQSPSSFSWSRVWARLAWPINICSLAPEEAFTTAGVTVAVLRNGSINPMHTHQLHGPDQGAQVLGILQGIQ